MTTKEALITLADNLSKDKSYYDSWVAVMASYFIKEYDKDSEHIREVAINAAEGFIDFIIAEYE